MALDKTCTDRNYLFGRLLGVADWAEKQVNQKQESTAMRLISEFVKKPCFFWKNISIKLLVPGNGLSKEDYRTMNEWIEEIMDKFSVSDFCDEPLNGMYLMGMHHQASAIKK